MSRAFVKEPDGDDFVEEVPERLQSPHVNYVTPAGLRQLNERLAELLEQRRLLAASTQPGARKQMRYVERDLRYFGKRVETAVLVDPSGLPDGEVCFGATVDVETEQGEVRSFTIVGEDEADAAEGRISWVSPLARALAGARVGDGVVWRRPAGEARLEVIAIRPPLP
jgi:transcription elongation GreA/GreB family factor